MPDNIFVTQPFMPPIDEFTPYLEEIWQNKWLTNNGKFHVQLEEELCDYLGVKYISLFSNGTLALITALQALKIKGEVITTPFSFVASTHALKWNGIKPVFCDIEKDIFNIDPDKIEAAITKKTKAILPVHVYGNPCNINKIGNIASAHGLKVIYDAAHAFGVNINNNSVCNYGDLSVLSFHATKVFTTFEGGAIICHDKKMKTRIDNLKNFGFRDEITVVAAGINAKMNELQSAFGLLQLKYIDKLIEKRKEITTIYRKKLSGVKGLSLSKDLDGIRYNYSYFPVLIENELFGCSRDELYNLLKKENIFTRRYFYPLISEFPTYRKLASASLANLPIAKEISEKVLCLPIYPNLDIKTINRIISIILRSQK